MAKLLTLHGQIINSTAYIYIYTYICCRVKNWSQDLGFLALKTGPSLVLKTGPSFSLISPVL